MSWKRYNLGELVDSVSIRAKDIYHENNLRFLGVSNESGITISKYAAENKAEDYKIIEKGCFAYNPYRINVGSVALMKDDLAGLISPAYVVFKPKPNSIIPELLLSFLKSKEGLRQIKSNARGTVRQALRFEDLCKIQLSLPCYDEQLELYSKLQKFEQQGSKQVIEHTHQLDLLKRLRQQILQDVLQGKIVSHDTNDEPADKLLERIKVQKEQLIREKKIKKDKPLPAIKVDEMLFKIPENWTWCRLGEIALFSEAGKSYKALENSANTGEYGVIKTSAITSTVFNEFENKKLPIQNTNYDKILINEGDLLFCRASGSKGLAGKSCLVLRKPKANLILSDKSIRYVFPENIVAQFVQYFNTSCFAEIYYMELGTGKSTTMNNITREQFDRLIIPLPPLPMQHRIVIKIEQLMKLCDELEQIIQQNQKYTLELLQMALKEALEPQ